MVDGSRSKHFGDRKPFSVTLGNGVDPKTESVVLGMAWGVRALPLGAARAGVRGARRRVVRARRRACHDATRVARRRCRCSRRSCWDSAARWAASTRRR